MMTLHLLRYVLKVIIHISSSSFFLSEKYFTTYKQDLAPQLFVQPRWQSRALSHCQHFLCVFTCSLTSSAPCGELVNELLWCIQFYSNGGLPSHQSNSSVKYNNSQADFRVKSISKSFFSCSQTSIFVHFIIHYISYIIYIYKIKLIFRFFTMS